MCCHDNHPPLFIILKKVRIRLYVNIAIKRAACQVISCSPLTSVFHLVSIILPSLNIGLLFSIRYFFPIIPLCVLTLSLAACAPKQPYYPPPPTSTENASVALAEAAGSVNHSLMQLNSTDQAAHPPQNIAEPPAPSTYGMNIPASLEWNGPVEQALAELAKASNYTFHVVGDPPPIPLIVYVSQKNSNVGDIVRNMGLQCKNQASIVVYPKNRLIELRYVQAN